MIEDIQLREARRLSDLAALAYREHIGQAHTDVIPCAQCHIAASRKNLSALCPAGNRLAAERREAAEAFKRERKDAARPNPSQESLFDI
jgi:hypothetical protein